VYNYELSGVNDELSPSHCITRETTDNKMVDDPPSTGTTGPIAYPAAGDIAPNLMSDTGVDNRSTNESSRPSTGTTAINDPSQEIRSGSLHSDGDGNHDRGHGMEEDGLRFPPTLRTMTSVSGKPYSSFSSGMKWFIVTLAGIAAVFSPIR